MSVGFERINFYSWWLFTVDNRWPIPAQVPTSSKSPRIKANPAINRHKVRLRRRETLCNRSTWVARSDATVNVTSTSIFSTRTENPLVHSQFTPRSRIHLFILLKVFSSLLFPQFVQTTLGTHKNCLFYDFLIFFAFVLSGLGFVQSIRNNNR